MRSPHEEVLSTPFGEMKMVVWESSMNISCGNSQYSEPEAIIINGVAYVGRFTMRFEDGEWKKDLQSIWYSFHREDDYFVKFSASAREKFLAVVPEMMIAWAETDEAKAIFERLEREAKMEQFERLGKDISEKQAEIDELDKQREALAEELGLVSKMSGAG